MRKFVALVSGQAGFEGLARFAEENPGDKVICIAQEFFPSGSVPGNVSLHREEDFLSGKEIRKIDEKALFFSREWYRFDGKFEEAISFGGVCLASVSEFAIFNIFQRIFLAVKSAAGAARREKAAAIVSVEGTFIGECARAAARDCGISFVGLEVDVGKNAGKRAGLGMKKVRESAGKILRALKGKALTRKKGKTVFVKSNGYLDGLCAELGREKGLSPFSLDDLLVRRLLNPFRLMEFSRVRKDRKGFFGELFAGLFGSPLFRKRLVFEGIGFSRAFEVAMRRFSGRDWPEFVFVIGLLREEFRKKKPCALVVWEDWIPFEKICVLLARQFNVKSLVVQHGLFKSSSSLPGWVRGFAPVYADRIAVWGPHFKRLLEGKEVPPEKIVVTGAPRFDAVFKRGFDDNAFRKGLGLGKGERLVVLATQPYTLNTMPPLALAARVLEAVKKMPGTRLAIKVHPLERAGDYSEVVEAAAGKAFVLEKADLYGLLHCADAVIVHSSTVGIEAMLLKRPVISYAEMPGQGVFPEEAGLLASSGRELKEMLARALSGGFDERAERLVYEMAFRQDGNATKRVIAALKGQNGGKTC